MIWLLAACTGQAPSAPAPPPLEVRAEETTFRALTELGSFQLQASLSRTLTPLVDGAPQGEPSQSTETWQLRWQDNDHWSLQRGRDGQAAETLTVLGRQGWTQAGGGPTLLLPDAEPLRVQVAQVVDPWRLGLDPIERQLQVIREELEPIAGRSAVRYRVDAQALPKGARATWALDSVTGQVWVDERTAARLAAQVEATAHNRHQQLQLTLKFGVSEVGDAQTIVTPVATEGLTPAMGAPVDGL